MGRPARIRTTGVYVIRNRVNGHVYVGSSKDLDHRRRCHWSLLAHGKHHCIKLQRAWKRDGEAAFEWVILTECSEEEVRKVEQLYLDAMAGRPECYNIALDASSPSMTQEVREKIGRALKGRPRSKEYREKISAGLRGKPSTVSPEGKQRRMEATKRTWTGREHTPEARAKMSAAKKGKAAPPGFVDRMRAVNVGRKNTTEAKERMSVAQKRQFDNPARREQLRKAAVLGGKSRAGKRRSPESVAKGAASQRGRTYSVETRLRMSDAAKRRCARQRDTREHHPTQIRLI